MTKESYTKLQAQLDDIMAQLQSDDLDVDEAVKLYEKGLKLTEKLEAQLKRAKNTVNTVSPEQL